jgi:hypothetical protein
LKKRKKNKGRIWNNMKIGGRREERRGRREEGGRRRDERGGWRDE